MKNMEFEGRTEREAVAFAAAELGSESFDVEILEKSSGLFGRGKVRIKVRPLDSIPDPLYSGDSYENKTTQNSRSSRISKTEVKEKIEVPADAPSKDLQNQICEYIEGIIERMGFSGTASYKGMVGFKAVFEISSESSNILIGRKGRNLDAIQLLINAILNRIVGDVTAMRIVIDTDGYRARREESLVRMAHRMADEIVRNRSSRLLEPMNPFERRLIHTTISVRDDVITKSEGEGLYKRVRITARSVNRNKSGKRR